MGWQATLSRVEYGRFDLDMVVVRWQRVATTRSSALADRDLDSQVANVILNVVLLDDGGDHDAKGGEHQRHGEEGAEGPANLPKWMRPREVRWPVRRRRHAAVRSAHTATHTHGRGTHAHTRGAQKRLSKVRCRRSERHVVCSRAHHVHGRREGHRGRSAATAAAAKVKVIDIHRVKVVLDAQREREREREMSGHATRAAGGVPRNNPTG